MLKCEDHPSSLLNHWLLPKPAVRWRPPCLYTHWPLFPEVSCPSQSPFKSQLKGHPLCKSLLASPVPPRLPWKLVRTSVIHMPRFLAAHGLYICLSKSQQASQGSNCLSWHSDRARKMFVEVKWYWKAKYREKRKREKVESVQEINKYKMIIADFYWILSVCWVLC